ncbi:MAG: PAS domain S-box protein, partial [Candidatus Marinimicrobia bacterium]|nr:PAS domain S-box protein [Candidatus Neomarinimicrobiota bacterium]
MNNKLFRKDVVLPILIFLFMVFISINVWKFFEYQKIQDITLKTELVTDLVATHLEERLETHLEIIKFLRREWLENNINTRIKFEKMVLPLINSFPGFQAINYIDTNGIIRWVYPEAPNIEAKNKDLHNHPFAAETFILAESTGADCATQALELWQGGLGIATYFPLIREGRLEGYLNGVFKINDFIHYYFKQEIDKYYYLHLKEDNREFYFVGDDVADNVHSITSDYPVSILNRNWIVSLSPRPELFDKTSSYVNKIILIMSVFLSGIFAYVIRLLVIRRQELSKSERKYRDLFEKSDDAILIIKDGNFVDCNQATVKMLRYNDKKELLNTHPSVLSPEVQPDGRPSLEKADEMMKIALEKGSHRFEWDHKKADGAVFPVEVLLTSIPGNGETPIIHTVWRDMTERKRADRMQAVVYQISDSTHKTKNLDALYRSIHQSLSNVLDVTNFYIAVFDEKVNLLSFPYYRDAKDNFPISARPLGKGLTEYIMKTGKPLLLSKKNIEAYADKGEIEVVGTLPEIWMGAPLTVGTKVIGAIAVNSYDDKDLYTKSDLKILTFVSEQIALSIEHKQALTELEVEKTYLEELFTNSPEAVALVDTESNVLQINPEFTSLFGYTEEEIRGKNIDGLLTDRKQLKNAEKLAHEVLAGRRIFAEAIRRKKDGSDIPVSILGSP